MKHLFFHKADLDGRCSGAIMRYNSLRKKEEFKMHPFDYGMDFPFSDISSGDQVFFADVVPAYEKLKEINEKYDLTIIDHHKTLIQFIDTNKLDIKGLRSVEFSACELCWKYFARTAELPIFVNLLGRYDIWDMSNKEKWDREILPFQYGMRLENLDPSTDDGFERWVRWMSYNHSSLACEVEDFIVLGKNIMEYQKLQDEISIDAYGFDAELDGLKAICVNAPNANSKTFESKWDEDKYDLMFRFCQVPGNYGVSVYSTKIDVSEIATKYGGGGHRGAAGFNCKDIIFADGRVVIIIDS